MRKNALSAIKRNNWGGNERWGGRNAFVCNRFDELTI